MLSTSLSTLTTFSLAQVGPSVQIHIPRCALKVDYSLPISTPCSAVCTVQSLQVQVQIHQQVSQAVFGSSHFFYVCIAIDWNTENIISNIQSRIWEIYIQILDVIDWFWLLTTDSSILWKTLHRMTQHYNDDDTQHIKLQQSNYPIDVIYLWRLLVLWIAPKGRIQSKKKKMYVKIHTWVWILSCLLKGTRQSRKKKKCDICHTFLTWGGDQRSLSHFLFYGLIHPEMQRKFSDF